jgi:MEMO1 family protein
MGSIRRPAVAGSWYPGSAAALAAAVDALLRQAPAAHVGGDLIALVSPHAGLMYSGPVAAHAYQLLRTRAFDVAVLVGPSHYVGFDGVALYADDGGFETPLGTAAIDRECADALQRASPIVRTMPTVHGREHSLEMQLPLLMRVAPSIKIVPLLVGAQTAATAEALGDALAQAVRGRRALLVASTDLSHYHDAQTAARLDRVVIDCVERLDADGLQRALDVQPEHACGGGPTVAVIRAARMLGANRATILNYADSGDVSGDKSSVVGYLAAALARSSGPAEAGHYMPGPAEAGHDIR